MRKDLEDVRKAAAEWLDNNGYDGLSDGDECACSLRWGRDKLFHCGELRLTCAPILWRCCWNCGYYNGIECELNADPTQADVSLEKRDRSDCCEEFEVEP